MLLESEAVLKQLGYTPTEALLGQLKRAEANTPGYEKIQKHLLDLHEQLKVDDSYVALANSADQFKIKIEAPSDERCEEALEKVYRFSHKYKVALEAVQGKKLFHVTGFDKEQ